MGVYFISLPFSRLLLERGVSDPLREQSEEDRRGIAKRRR
jgi:hypothetical protein